MRKLTFPTPAFIGFLQALGIAAYLFLVNALMSTRAVATVARALPSAITPFLLLLIALSLLVLFALTFLYPLSLVVQRKNKRALAVVLCTIGSVAVLMILIVIIAGFLPVAPLPPGLPIGAGGGAY